MYYKILLAKLPVFLQGKHETWTLYFQVSTTEKYIFLNSLALLDHTTENTALCLSSILLFKKGGAFLPALPFKHSWWFYFQLKIFVLVTDVLILLTEMGQIFLYILNKFFKLLLHHWTLSPSLCYQPSL